MSKFEIAAGAIKKSAEASVKMADDQLLQIYGLYKQGTVGDNNTDKPGMLDFKGKKKYEAWSANKGMSKEEAQTKYAALAATLLAKYGQPVPEEIK